MKKLLLLVALAGCGPLALDFTVGWGSNQTIKKTLEMDQKQTKAQSDAAVSVVDGIITILPAFLVPEPTPTPAPAGRVSRVIIEMSPTPTPTPRPKKPVVKKARIVDLGAECIYPCTRIH